MRTESGSARTAICPLCIEELDDTDRHFIPCKCGYQICIWCFHRVKAHDNLCPHCRSAYADIPSTFTIPAPMMGSPDLDERKKRAKATRKIKQEKKPADQGQPRVIVPNVVYLVGLPEAISKDEILSQPAYLGQYGHVFRIIVHRNPEKYRDTCTAHVTFFDDDAARRCIAYLNGFQYQGKTIQAFIGTTKYPEDITTVDQSLKPAGEPIAPENPIFPVVRRNPTAADVVRQFEMSIATKQINAAKMQLMGYSVTPGVQPAGAQFTAPPPPPPPPPTMAHTSPMPSNSSTDLQFMAPLRMDRSMQGIPVNANFADGLPADGIKVEQNKEGMMQSPRGVMDLATALNMGPNPCLAEVVLGTGGLYSYIWSADCEVNVTSWMGSPSVTARKGASPLQIAFVPAVIQCEPDERSSRSTSTSSFDGDEEEMERLAGIALDPADRMGSTRASFAAVAAKQVQR